MENNGQTTSESPDQRKSPPAQMNCSDGEDSDPMEDFSQQLEDIIQTYGSAATLMEQQISSLEAVTDGDKTLEDPGGELEDESGSAPGTDTTHFIRSLEKLASPEEKLGVILKKYIELVECQRGEQRRNNSLQKKSDNLLMQKDQLQFDLSRAILARAKLESLCRDLQEYNKTLKVEHLQKRHEDEDRRKELTTHFQSTLTDIQAQIDEHSNRNSKLCQENSILAEKLNNIIHQYEKREESLEKIFKHHEMQQKLSDTKLEQANILMKEAEVKHKREKEYLLKEAIALTKKCHAMKEQELQMKKQLVLYAQKFDEFQVTLGKSNDVYISFKQEMDKMTKKMKNMEKESEFWKTRFESCNKALQDLIEERSEKAKEFELFTLKVDKLETLCRALQEERRGLYDKIRGIRFDISQATLAEEPAIKTSDETPSVGLGLTAELDRLNAEQAPLQDETPSMGLGLTAELDRLNAEQARLQEFAASLATSNVNELEDSDDDTAKLPSVPEELSEVSSENKISQSDPCHQESKTEQIQSETAESEIAHLPEEVTEEPSTPRETKADDQAPEQVKQRHEDAEKDCEDHASVELDLSKDTKPDAVLPIVEVDSNQQKITNSESVQKNLNPMPKQAEKAEAKEDADKVQPVKQERKKNKVPKEKPIVEGAVKTEAASQSQAQPQTSKLPSAKPQGKKQGTPKKKSQSKNVKK